MLDFGFINYLVRDNEYLTTEEENNCIVLFC